MVRSTEEKLLGSNLPVEFVDDFWEKAIPEGSKMNKGQVVKAMAELWLDLPEDARNKYLFPVSTHPLEDIISQAVDDKLAVIRDALSPAQQKKIDDGLRELEGGIS